MPMGGLEAGGLTREEQYLFARSAPPLGVPRQSHGWQRVIAARWTNPAWYKRPARPSRAKSGRGLR